MSDKKIIIIALILALALVAGGWIYSQYKKSPGPVAISESSEIEIAGLVFGNENAPVIIEEYTNFLCPACANFALSTLPRIEANYIKTGKAKMVFYIFPPPELSKAGFCAGQVGKFIEYHDYLFSHQKQITDEKSLFDFATNIGLDGKIFQQCYNSKEATGAVQGWLEEGQARGVDATPTFFINGQKLIGAQSYAEFEKIIEQKLK